MAGILKVDELHNALGNNCASLTNTGIAVRVANYAGEGSYPTLTAAESGYMIYDSVLKTMVFWDGSEWFQLKKQGSQDGSTPANAIANFTTWYSDGGTGGSYWVKPDGYGGSAELVTVDVDGSGPVTDSGVWITIRYAQSYYTRGNAWRGQSGLTNPSSQSTTAYSGDFAFEQSEGFINALLDNASEVRQIFESWGYGSVGWTYQGSNAYMEGKGIDGVNYTRWGGNGGTHTGVSGGRLSGMSHSIDSINGPWANPTANRTDQTDRNDSTWRYGRFYFRYTSAGGSTRPLPIKGVYNADVDGGSEQRYFPFRDAAGGWSGSGESNIYIKVV